MNFNDGNVSDSRPIKLLTYIAYCSYVKKHIKTTYIKRIKKFFSVAETVG